MSSQRPRGVVEIIVEAGAIAALAIAVACTGPVGPQGPPGTSGGGGDGGTSSDGGGTTTALTQETCMICHGSGQAIDDIPIHKADVAPALARSFARITAVNIPGTAPVTPTITFTVTGADGGAVGGLTSFNFVVSQLVPTDADGGSIDNWRSLINRNYLAADAGSISPGGTTEVSANARSSTTPSAQLSGTLSEGPAGTYTYVFGNDLATAVADNTNLPTYGVVSVAFDPTLTTRFGLQSGAPLPGQNPTTLPDGGVVQPTAPFTATVDVFSGGGLSTDAGPGGVQQDDSRPIAIAQSCEQCHQRLTAHGRRINVNYCVNCHNAYSFDPQTPATNRQTVDFKRVVHALHMGNNLPSVKAGGTFTFNGVDFSDVTFPAMSWNGTSDPGNCTMCHSGTSTDPNAYVNAWKNKPTRAACQSCHDRTSFDTPPPAGFTLHSGGALPDDRNCALCHASGAAQAPIDQVHTGLPSVQATITGKYKYNIISVTNTAAGQNPVVTYSVTNPQDGGVYDLANDPAWTQTTTGNSRLAIDIAWSTLPVTTAGDVNYDNQGSGTNPGQPVTIDALKNKAQVGTTNTYTVTSPTAVPANALSGEVVMEGHPSEAVPPNSSNAVQTRIPVTSATKTFGVTGTAPTRRKVVDINKCNACHSNLTLHGSNRTSSIETCVACHNTNATDINQRPKTGTPVDNKVEEAIDFKQLIHRIHGAQFSGNGPVIYGFGGSVNDFRTTSFPGNDACRSNPDNCLVGSCEICHVAGTYSASFAPARGTTTSTATLTDPSTYLRTTRITATCSSCHAQSLPETHMKQNGGAFNVTQSQIDAAQ